MVIEDKVRSISEKVKGCFREIMKMDDVEIDMDENLFEKYGLDSVRAVKLISDIEIEYDIDIHDEVAQEIKSLNDVVSIIKKLAFES